MHPIINYGFTVYFVIGKWAMPKIQIMQTTRSLRISLGFVAIKIGLYDLERWEKKVLKAYIDTDDKLKELK